MRAFRVFLGLIFVLIVGYTVVVGTSHGWNLLPVFFGDIMAMTWPGQFNIDFMGFLLLSGIWVSWRHHFSPAGLALGTVAVFGGILFLSLYLLITSFLVKGEIKPLLLGKMRAITKTRRQLAMTAPGRTRILTPLSFASRGVLLYIPQRNQALKWPFGPGSTHKRICGHR